LEGRVTVDGFKIFYRSVGDPRSYRVLVGLHGGPGATLDYLTALDDLTKYGYRIVLYNQLGSDKSDVPKDDSPLTMEHFVDEVESIRTELNLGKIHLLGHSWGGMLCLAYALKYQEHLKSLIVCSGLASVPLTAKETDRLVSEMPAEAQRILRKYPKEGDFDNLEYQSAYQKYIREVHSFRGKERPKELNYTLTHMNKRVFRYMEGPDDLNMTGTLKDWDVTDQLGSLNVPCLITVGKYDSVTPAVAESTHEHVRGSKLVTFENSSHFAMWEEKELFIETLRRFLDNVEESGS
jgi:proline iminopeptidase